MTLHHREITCSFLDACGSYYIPYLTSHIEVSILHLSDPDAGDTHVCTDWEIWSVSPAEMVWGAGCQSGVEKLRVHLADGDFVDSYGGRADFFYGTSYRLRVRHLDNIGRWSDYAERVFATGEQTQIYPLALNNVNDFPPPRLLDETDVEIILPAGATPPTVRIESAASDLLLEISGADGITNNIDNPSPLATHQPVRVVISVGSSGVLLPSSTLVFNSDDGSDHTLFLPPVNLSSSQKTYFWISNTGSSYFGEASQTAPDFSLLARGSSVSWTVSQSGYKVEIVATGFQLPVNIAFHPNPGDQPDDPFYYVTELYGAIKVITRGGEIIDYASGLLNFNPTGNFPGSGEQGLSGIVVEPTTGDVFANLLYDAVPPNGPRYPKVVRFQSADGGLTAATQMTILNMPGEEQGQSHFISNLTIGPDGKLYVHMGDGFNAATALNLNSFRGKILRLNLDGFARQTIHFMMPAPASRRRIIFLLTACAQSIRRGMASQRRISLRSRERAERRSLDQNCARQQQRLERHRREHENQCDL